MPFRADNSEARIPDGFAQRQLAAIFNGIFHEFAPAGNVIRIGYVIVDWWGVVTEKQRNKIKKNNYLGLVGLLQDSRISGYIPGTGQQGIYTQIHWDHVGLILHLAAKNAHDTRTDAHNNATGSIHVVDPAGDGFTVGSDN